MTRRARAALLAGAALMFGALAAGAREVAEPRREGPFGCDEPLMIFESLEHGAFDYCRLHLRYRPGAADCLRILLPTCNVSGPGEPPRMYAGKDDWILHGHGERIICPPGPPPPSCPAGFPGGAIPRP